MNKTLYYVQEAFFGGLIGMLLGVFGHSFTSLAYWTLLVLAVAWRNAPKAHA